MSRSYHHSIKSCSKMFKWVDHLVPTPVKIIGLRTYVLYKTFFITACEIGTKTHDKYKSKVNVCLFCVLYYSPMEGIKWTRLIRRKRRKRWKRLKVILDQPEGVLFSKIHIQQFQKRYSNNLAQNSTELAIFVVYTFPSCLYSSEQKPGQAGRV